ncbi:MAG TPA: AmmeMemoRadiSam system protein B [Methylomirabilota bacterium]|nr:AmmeMemoRadiSam system protein B [Methylomirabilota bacterium]
MRLAPALVALTVSLTAAAEVRPPAVAGAFYPGDGGALRAEVEGHLERARAADKTPPARAVVVPHAGFGFSGATAARSFASLPGTEIGRVILLGPSHHVSFSGGALPAADVTAFRTPLGDVPLDLEAIAALRGRPGFDGPARAHGPEHALEVELPFLQVVAPDARLVPIVVGPTTSLDACRALARSLASLLDDGTVVVVSSDFTHHGRRYGWNPYDGPDLADTLLEVGRDTAGRIAAGDPRGFFAQVEVSRDTVCGNRPIAVLTELVAHAFSGRGEVLEVTTSGHLTGSFDLSVTYAAVAFSGSWKAWDEPAGPPARTLEEEEGRRLLELARATLQSWLSHDTSVARWFADNPGASGLLMPAGAFVTLNNTGRRARTDGKLRACMGVIEAERPLVDAVVQAAVWAAQDPRFPSLELDELDRVEVEVSVLSPPVPVASAEAIEVGRHGVVLTVDGHRAVFLPQVAVEQGWERDAMLDHLSLKAGLARDAWRRGGSFEVFTAQVFSEGP